MRCALGVVNVVLLLPVLSMGQLEASKWYFGENAGIDFQDGSLSAPDILLDGSLSTPEGCATISDSDGDLLFYTDGVTAYNRDHQIMENGEFLLGNASSTQSAIIVPNPSDPSIYYIFTVDRADIEEGQEGLNYSVVDMTLDGGLGAIVDEQKNINLLPRCSEKITAIRHSFTNTFWVIAFTLDRTFHVYEVGFEGVRLPAVTSGFVGDLEDGRGYIKLSPNGEKIAIAHYGDRKLFLYDFDANTGLVSNEVELPLEDDFFPYGVEFSSESRRFYHTAYRPNLSTSKLYQLDMESADVPGSSTVIATSVEFRSSLQLGIDGKIYRTRQDMPFLGVINSPSEIGLACDYQEEGLGLQGRLSKEGLPPFVQSFFEVDIQFNDNCLGIPAQFFINTNQPIFSVTWDFGEPVSGSDNTSNLLNPTHLYRSAGSFTVNASVIFQDLRTAAFRRVVQVFPTPVANPPRSLITCVDNLLSASVDLTQQDTDILGTQSASSAIISYHSSQEDANSGLNRLPDPYIGVDGETVYARIQSVSATSCFDTTNFQLEVNEDPMIPIEENYFTCPMERITISVADPTFVSYLWSTGETDDTVQIDTAGSYSITVTNNEGCTIAEEFTAIDIVIPIISEVVVTNDNIEIIPQDGDFEYSIDGINYQPEPVFLGLPSSNYLAYARDRENCGIDTFAFDIIEFQRFFTPNGDGFNDTWAVPVLQGLPGSVVYIFDRFGELLKTLGPDSSGWNGSYNGDPLPASDYWYRVVFPDGREFRGHFALKR